MLVIQWISLDSFCHRLTGIISVCPPFDSMSDLSKMLIWSRPTHLFTKLRSRHWPPTTLMVKTKFCHKLRTAFLVWVLPLFLCCPLPHFPVAATLVMFYFGPWCHRVFAYSPSAWGMAPSLLHLSFSSHLSCNLLRESFLGQSAFANTPLKLSPGLI